MSSITMIPSYSTTLSSNLQNINVPLMRPAYLSSKPLMRPVPPTYQHLNQQIQRKPSLYGAGQRKYNAFNKFQSGTTTTFNGYSNFIGHRVQNVPLPLPRRNPPNNYNYNNRNHYQKHYNEHNNMFYNDNLEPLMNLNPFHAPSRNIKRSNYHAQLFNINYHHQSRWLSRNKYNILTRLPSRTLSPYHQLPPPIKPHRRFPSNYRKKMIM